MRARARTVLPALVLAGIGSLLWALLSGELQGGWPALAGALTGSEDYAASVVRELRLPRALAAYAGGAMLAVAGALMQILLRNPLADPYVLGVSGGAAVGALGALTLGLGGLATDAAAFSGALVAMLLVFGLARGDGSWTQTRLLLTGVIVAAGCGAAVTLMLALATDTRVHSMLFWLMGDASAARNPWPALAVLALSLMACMPLARDLNVLSRGELGARALGVPVDTLRRVVFLLASALTAVAVTLIGTVGFVGLIVPHLVRLLIGNDQRLLLPAAALAGGALLVAADTAARLALSPLQLPVGVLTALIGVPVFLFLLARQFR